MQDFNADLLTQDFSAIFEGTASVIIGPLCKLGLCSYQFLCTYGESIWHLDWNKLGTWGLRNESSNETTGSKMLQ